MLFSTPILDMVSVSNNHERGQDPGLLSYVSHIGICRPKGYCLWAVLVVWKHFKYFGMKYCMVFEETTGAYMYECIYRFQF